MAGRNAAAGYALLDGDVPAGERVPVTGAPPATLAIRTVTAGSPRGPAGTA